MTENYAKLFHEATAKEGDVLCGANSLIYI
jgi:hypothetical protein